MRSATFPAIRVLHEAVAGLRRVEDFAIARGLLSETPDWGTPQRAREAIREGVRLLSWMPYTGRRAELGNGRSRESIVPFGGTGFVVHFEVIGDDAVVGAVRHQRDEVRRH